LFLLLLHLLMLFLLHLFLLMRRHDFNEKFKCSMVEPVVEMEMGGGGGSAAAAPVEMEMGGGGGSAAAPSAPASVEQPPSKKPKTISNIQMGGSAATTMDG
jgi:hypothetical protein